MYEELDKLIIDPPVGHEIFEERIDKYRTTLCGNTLPVWANVGARVISSVHGPSTVTFANSRYIGVHFDKNHKDRMTDCRYEYSNGIYTSGHGIDELTPNAEVTGA